MSLIPTCTVFTTPKAGSSLQENEDAFAIHRDADVARFVIADGATQASFSRLWANLLVENAKKYIPSVKRLKDYVIPKAQLAWQQNIASRQLPWYAEEKAKKGAFASLLWLSIKSDKHLPESGGKWKAVAIGDSNLFVFRRQECIQAFPVQVSSEFGSSPILISSIQSSNVEIFTRFQKVEGDWQAGDEFILATDALACYLLKQIEAGENPLYELQSWLSGSSEDQLAFESLMQSLRSEAKMKNDDTTLIWIRCKEQLDFIGNIDDNCPSNSQ